MDTSGLRFTAGMGPGTQVPLARYLPPIPAGSAAAWLAEHLPQGSWVLDPLGASPALALEIARAGYRVIVASNNPINTFLIEILASAPKTADFQSVLAELATVKRGEERLEKHIQRLYLTECSVCGESVTADAFLWRKGEAQPFGRSYRCLKCGESGDQPVTASDLERLSALGGDRMQRARALQRVILNEDEFRADVEEALSSYLPRALYALFTVLNKAEGLGLSPDRLRLVQALLLSMFDAGNTLWTYPGGRSRPKQLTTPPQFRELNLWNALEEAAGVWVGAGARVPVTRWPEQPPAQGGIALFRGRVKALVPLPAEVGPQAVVSAFPRPNQAFWTLSVLWAGWLWGPEATLPLRNVLDRRRYDWNWHTAAIHSALAALVNGLPPGTPFFGLLPEMAPGFLAAVVVAAEAAGLDLTGLALRSEQDIAQALWLPYPSLAPSSPATAPTSSAQEQSIREAMRSDLLARSEPAPYPALYAAGLIGLARAGAVPRSSGNLPGDLLTRLQATLARTFADRSYLHLYGPAEEERGWWWLTSASPASLAELPLADRVEMETVRYLQRNAQFTFDALDQFLCAQFPGLLTPPVELVRACLDSYGETVPQATGAPAQPILYRLRASESAAARKADLQEMREELETIGRRLGYHVTERDSALVWEGLPGERWVFFRMASSIISRFVLGHTPKPDERCVIILPGGRARLLSFKLRRDPRLVEMINGNPPAGTWRFLKFRHLRDIAAHAGLAREEWESLLDEDPLTDEATQMPLFAT